MELTLTHEERITTSLAIEDTIEAFERHIRDSIEAGIDYSYWAKRVAELQEVNRKLGFGEL